MTATAPAPYVAKTAELAHAQSGCQIYRRTSRIARLSIRLISECAALQESSTVPVNVHQSTYRIEYVWVWSHFPL